MAEIATVSAGSTFTTSLADPGNVADLGLRIEVPLTRAIVSYWRRATRLQDGSWTVITEAPPDPGGYLMVWRTGDPEPPAYEVFIPLLVNAAGTPVVTVEDPPDVDRARVTPEIEDVAALERTRTIAEGTNEEVTFTESTRPTAAEVQELIQQALDLVLAELPSKFPIRHYDAVRRAVALYTAILIEGSYFREQSDEGSVALWRTLYSSALINLQREVQNDLARVRNVRLQGGRVLV